MRLPNLRLWHSGHLTIWTTFWQSFEAAVDDNPDLSNFEKFYYLSSLLESTAREDVSGILLTDADYVEAEGEIWRHSTDHQQA